MAKRERKIESLGEEEKPEIEERVIQIDRVSRTVAGGRRIRFRALVAVGDKNGSVGIGTAKASDVATAVSKATKMAKQKMIKVPIINDTIPHPILVNYGSSRLLLKPARKGSSIVAGGTIRTLAELAGIRNLSAKILGSQNKLNNAKAVHLAFEELRREYEKKKESR